MARLVLDTKIFWGNTCTACDNPDFVKVWLSHTSLEGTRAKHVTIYLVSMLDLEKNADATEHFESHQALKKVHHKLGKSANSQYGKNQLRPTATCSTMPGECQAPSEFINHCAKLISYGAGDPSCRATSSTIAPSWSAKSHLFHMLFSISAAIFEPSLVVSKQKLLATSCCSKAAIHSEPYRIIYLLGVYVQFFLVSRSFASHG